MENIIEQRAAATSVNGRVGSEGGRMYGYVRVSTREQNEARQVIALQEFGVPAQHILMDKQSGKDFDRPAYQKLLTQLHPGDVLVIKSIDRLGRNYSDILDQWRLITKNIGAAIVVLDMPLLDTRSNRDLTGTLIADIVLQLLSYVAETERTFIRQRQAEGIAAAKARGVRFGPKPIEHGPEWDECESEYERSLVDERRESLLRRRGELAALRARYAMTERSGSEYVSRLEEAAAESYSAFESTSSELASVRETARLAEEKSASLSAENERITERFLAQKEESAAAANAAVEKLAKEYERRISEAAAAKEREMSELREKLESERDLLSARVAALCAEKGEGSDKTDRESFLELEREKAAFDRYFKEQWAKAKKRVRREEYAKRKNGK